MEERSRTEYRDPDRSGLNHHLLRTGFVIKPPTLNNNSVVDRMFLFETVLPPSFPSFYFGPKSSQRLKKRGQITSNIIQFYGPWV